MFSGLLDKPYNSEGVSHILKLINVKGNANNWIWFKAYPGEKPIITQTSQARGFTLHSVSFMGFEGLTIQNAYGWGIGVFDSDNLEIRNVTVRDTDGLDNNNVAGIYSNVSRNINVHHSIIHDNYDRLNHDTGGQKTENSRNLVFFRGGNVKVRYNTIFQTPPVTASKTGGCLVYKHGQDVAGGIFEVSHNTFRNCFFAAIGTVTYGGRFHHNLIIDSDNSISVRNHGDRVNLSDNIAEYNTIVGGVGLQWNPWEALDVNSPLGKMTFRNNIVVDKRTTYNSDVGGILVIDPYGRNPAYDRVMAEGLFESNNNCYYNPNRSLLFGFFSSNHAPDFAKGGLYTFAQWKQLGFDVNSIQDNPQLNSITFQPALASCLGKGNYAP
jgi:hypothetical protein